MYYFVEIVRISGELERRIGPLDSYDDAVYRRQSVNMRIDHAEQFTRIRFGERFSEPPSRSSESPDTP